MSKIKVFIISLISIFLITSCYNDTKNDGYYDNSVDGGPDSKIACRYYFEEYDDLLIFYNQFKQNNEERYLILNNMNDNLSFLYLFVSEGVLVKDVNDRRYDLDFPLQTLYLNLNIYNFEIEGKCYDIQELNEDDIKESEYILNYKKYYYELEIFCGDSLIFFGKVKKSSNYDGLDDTCKIILDEFRQGFF